MDKQNFTKNVYKKIKILDNNSPSSKAIKADLRKSLGKPISENPDIWGFVYSDYELDKWQEKSDDINREEKVLVDILSLYSLHSRYNDNAFSENKDDTFPAFLKALKAQSSNFESFDKQVGQLFATTDYKHAIRLINKFISLSRSSKKSINYTNFGWELLLLDTSKRKNVLFNWGRQYYSSINKNNQEKE